VRPATKTELIEAILACEETELRRGC